MQLLSNAQFAEDKLRIAFENLKDSDQELYFHLAEAIKNIENNAFSGIQIPKRLIPKEYMKNYNIRNLWKYNLPNGWRLMYSIESTGIIVVSIILEWLTHKEYERRFKY